MIFTLRNQFEEKIFLSLEPEGTMLELLPDEFVKIELKSEESPAIDLQIQKYNNTVCIAIWPDKGQYEILD